jgi:hypothetical protein
VPQPYFRLPCIYIFDKDKIVTVKQNYIVLKLSVSLLLSHFSLVPAIGKTIDINQHLPRPGLYRVDFDGLVSMPIGEQNGGFRHRIDGNTGDLVAHQFANGERTADQFYKGDKANTICIAPYDANAASKSAALALLGKQAQCSDQSTRYTKDGYIHTANCSGSKLVLTVKKIDTDVWEYTAQTTLFQSMHGPDMNTMQMVDENMAKNGNTAEREKWRQAMAQLPAMKNKMQQGQLDTLALMKRAEQEASTPEEAAMVRSGMDRMTGKSPSMVSTVTDRRTRIGDQCK